MSSFLEQLEQSKTLKVKFKGKMYPVPPPIFKQAKKFALESVGIEYDVFKNNPTSEKAKEKQIKKAFEQFLESYLEAIVPDTKSNPTARKIESAFRVQDWTDAQVPGSLMARWFANKSEVEKKQLSSALKGAIMIVTHIYTEGAAKIPRERFGYKHDQTKEQQNKIDYDRLLRAAVGFITMSLIEKLYKMDPRQLENYLKAKVSPDELDAFWKDSKRSTGFFMQAKGQINSALANIDLIKALG